MRSMYLIALSVLLAVAAGLFDKSAARAQGFPDLKALALSRDDLGAEWQFDEEALLEDGALYVVSYGRPRSSVNPGAYLEILLVDDPARSITPREFLNAIVTGLRGRFRPGMVTAVTIDYVPPALVGDDTAQARFRVSLSGGFVAPGDVLAWRRGDVIAVMFYQSSSDVNVVPFAERQDRKLAGMR